MKGVNLHKLKLGKEFLDMTLKLPTTKEKKDKLDFLKTKNVCGASQVALVVKNRLPMQRT